MPDPVYFAGIRGTADFGVDERPKSFRESILMMNPNGNAPLFALTSKLSSESLNDPEFIWWNERNTVIRLTPTAAALSTANNITIAGGGRALRERQLVKIDLLGIAEQSAYGAGTVEIAVVSSVTDDTNIVLKRGQYGTTAVALTTNTTALTGLGTAFPENSTAPAPISRNPTKYRNYAQIFRTNFGISNTADRTKFRTGNAYKNDKRRATYEHARNIEMQLLFGLPAEVTSAVNGKPERTTGGLRSFITTNVTIFQGVPTEDTFLDSVYKIWDYDVPGGDQRIAFCGNGFLNSMNKLARNSTASQIQHTEVIKMYGMRLNVWQFPQGQIGFKTHPLLNIHPQYNFSAFIIDPKSLVYRHMRDTELLEDQQANGTDGKLDGYLTEAGLEVLAEEGMAYIGNFRV